MGRMLTPKDYGEVVSLMGLLVIVSVPAVTLVSLIAKYVAGFKATQEYNKIYFIYKKISSYSFFVGVVLFFVFCVFIDIISDFLQIDKMSIFVFGLIIPFSFIVSVYRGMLQGLQQFVGFSVLNIIVVVAKILFAVVAVFLGLSIPGVMVSFILANLSAYFFGLIKIKKHFKDKSLDLSFDFKSKIKFKQIYKYSSTIFWASLFLVIFINIDVVLAKHYLEPSLAGQYSVLSMLGKIIVYATGAFLIILFPKVSAASVKKDGSENRILKIALLFTLFVGTFVLFFYFFASDLVVKILFGIKYIEISSNLFIFGLAMLFNSLSQVFIYFFMAVDNKYFLKFFAFAIISQILLIVFFHASISQITLSLLVSCFVMFVIMSFIYLKQKNYEYAKITRNC